MQNPKNMNNSGRQNIILLIIFGFILFASNHLWGQQQPDPAKLIGNWLVDDLVTFNKLNPDTKAQMDTIPVFRQQMELLYSGRKINFAEDGSYSISLSNGQSLGGSWVLSENILTLTDSFGGILSREVRQINTNRMILLGSAERNDGTVPVPEIHYNKL